MNFRYRPPGRKKRETRLQKLARQFAAIRRPLAYGVGGLLSAILLFAAGSALLRERGQAAAQSAYDRADKYYAANDLPAARIELAKAVTAKPDWTPALIAQANVALEMFDGDTAKIALEKAVRLGAKQSDVAHLLGHALWMTGNGARAEQMLQSDDIPARNRAHALRILGRIYAARGNYPAAQTAFDEALKQAPKDSRLWTEIARMRLSMADHAGAIAASEKAVTAGPNDYRALEFRAQMVRSQYGLSAALPWFEKALVINPYDIPLLEEYAATLGEVGRNREMLEQTRKILALNSKNGRAFYMMAVIAVRAGNYPLAQRLLLLAGSKIGETPGAMLVSAVAEYELGNYHKSADILDQLSAIQPGNLRIRRLSARAKQSAGENLDALDGIAPLVTGRSASSYDAALSARALEAEGELQRAAASLAEASQPVIRPGQLLPEKLSLAAAADGASRNADDARFVIPYIRALLKAGDNARALSLAKRLQSINLGVTDSHVIVGDVETAMGDHRAATLSFERAQKLEFSEGIMLRLVDSYRRQKRFGDANNLLISFLSYNPNNLAAQRLTAYLFLDQERWAQSLPLLERLRKRVGYNDSILSANLARAYSGVGRHDDAIANARAAYRADPANPMVTLTYGQILQKAGKQPKAALELFQKADAMIPGNPDVAKGLKSAEAKFKKPAKKKAA